MLCYDRKETHDEIHKEKENADRRRHNAFRIGFDDGVRERRRNSDAQRRQQ